MGMKVIVEDVETEEQYAILQDMSCDQVQGYFIKKPGDVETITRFLHQNNNIVETVIASHFCTI